MNTQTIMPKARAIPAKAKAPVLFTRTTKAVHDWVHQTARKQGYSAQDWMNEVFTKMRKASVSTASIKAKKSRTVKKTTTKKSKTSARH